MGIKDSDEAKISNVRVAEMTENHLAGVFRISQENNLGYWSYEDYRSEIFRLNSVCLIAETCDMKTIAFMVARLIKLENCAELYNIATDEKYRRSGIAGKLLGELVKRSVDSNLNRIMLEVRKSNLPAINLYKSEGFTILGTKKDFYKSPVEDALTMIKILGEESNLKLKSLID